MADEVRGRAETRRVPVWREDYFRQRRAGRLSRRELNDHTGMIAVDMEGTLLRTLDLYNTARADVREGETVSLRRGLEEEAVSSE